MRVLAVLLVVLVVLVPAVDTFAQGGSDDDSLDAVPGGRPQMTPQQRQESLEKLSSLFIFTIILLVAMVVVLVVASIALRRRLRALEGRQQRAATQLEDLWWRMDGPNPFENEQPEEEEGRKEE